jgi:hypothetical protein
VFFSSPEGNALRSESCGKVHLRAVFLCEGKSKCRACSCSLCHPREPKTTQARDKQTTTFHVCKNRLCATNQKTLRFSASARNDKKTIQKIAPRWCAVLEASLLPALTLVCGFCPLCHFFCAREQKRAFLCGSQQYTVLVEQSHTKVPEKRLVCLKDSSCCSAKAIFRQFQRGSKHAQTANGPAQEKKQASKNSFLFCFFFLCSMTKRKTNNNNLFFSSRKRENSSCFVGSKIKF